MTEKEFTRMYEYFEEKEKILDGSCKFFQKEGLISKTQLIQSALIRHCGLKGKTRIVIEYDNDTGTGWHRIVSEDPESLATQQGRMANHPERERNPKDRN